MWLPEISEGSKAGGGGTLLRLDVAAGGGGGGGGAGAGVDLVNTGGSAEKTLLIATTISIKLCVLAFHS